MNSKNIKKPLNAKLNNWLESIEDKEIKKIIKENCIITGGALVSLLTGDEVHDYDVYFKTKDAVIAVSQYYIDIFNSTHNINASISVDGGKVKIFIQSYGVASDEEEAEQPDVLDVLIGEDNHSKDIQEQEQKPKYRPVYLTSNAITLSDKIQIVIRFYGDVEEIHKNYDFSHCTCAWSSWNNELFLPKKALECIINKELYYIGSKYPLCSIIRTRKFIKRGYTINAGQYLKMCLQLNELNLHDIETLKDQLVGVDSAYFDMAIKRIEKMKEQDTTFNVDNTYLFEVINRIF